MIFSLRSKSWGGAFCMKALVLTSFLLLMPLLFSLGCAAKQTWHQDTIITPPVVAALPSDASRHCASPDVEHKIIHLLPNPDVDSKVLRVATDPKVDYKIRVLSHGAETQQNDRLWSPHDQATVPRPMHWMNLSVDEQDSQNNDREGAP